MKIIDLTQLFISDMPVFPGDEKPSLTGAYDKQNDITQYAVTTGMHVGTHGWTSAYGKKWKKII